MIFLFQNCVAAVRGNVIRVSLFLSSFPNIIQLSIFLPFLFLFIPLLLFLILTLQRFEEFPAFSGLKKINSSQKSASTEFPAVSSR